MIGRASSLLAAAALLFGCADIPEDPEGTLDRVRATRVLRVGIVAGTDASGPVRQLLDRLSAHTGARAKLSSGAAEPLLARVEHGALDLVVGRFVEPTPWERQLTLSRPLSRHPLPHGTETVQAALRNGENGWIMLVDSTIAALPGVPAP